MIKICLRCSYTSDKPKKFIRGLCKNCRQYKKRTGNDRPEKLWSKPTHCTNPSCGVSLDKSKYRYLCQSCYIYLWRYEIRRPKSLCHSQSVH